jgi:hypothetical protein
LILLERLISTRFRFPSLKCELTVAPAETSNQDNEGFRFLSFPRKQSLSEVSAIAIGGKMPTKSKERVSTTTDEHSRKVWG